MKAEKDDEGRNVIFRALCRWGYNRTTRKIKEVRDDGSIEVRYGGYGNFHVRCDEIREIY